MEVNFRLSFLSGTENYLIAKTLRFSTEKTERRKVKKNSADLIAVSHLRNPAACVKIAAVIALPQRVYHHATVGSRVDELAVFQVNTNVVDRSGRALEKHNVTLLQFFFRHLFYLAENRTGTVAQMNSIHLLVDALDEARTVSASAGVAAAAVRRTNPGTDSS